MPVRHRPLSLSLSLMHIADTLCALYWRSVVDLNQYQRLRCIGDRLLTHSVCFIGDRFGNVEPLTRVTLCVVWVIGLGLLSPASSNEPSAISQPKHIVLTFTKPSCKLKTQVAPAVRVQAGLAQSRQTNSRSHRLAPQILVLRVHHSVNHSE